MYALVKMFRPRTPVLRRKSSHKKLCPVPDWQIEYFTEITSVQFQRYDDSILR